MEDSTLVEVLEMKERGMEDFGQRLSQIRKSRGFTQAELGKRVGVSNRVICYYEVESKQPPGPLLVDIANALRVSLDELLGRRSLKEKINLSRTRLLKRLMQVDELPKSDQHTVLKVVDGLLAKYNVSNGRSLA